MIIEIQKKILEQSENDLEKNLLELYERESEKIVHSIRKKCEGGNSQGITQTIGRRFGFFWEEMVKIVFEHVDALEAQKGLKIDISEVVLETIHSVMKSEKTLKPEKVKEMIKKIAHQLKGILESGQIELADLIYKKNDKNHGIELKWRIRWNDAKTVKGHCFAFHRLEDKGYEATMLIRRPKNESFKETVERFEKEGWNVLTGKDAMDFIYDQTGYDLESWIRSNVNFWEKLSEYKECLEAFTFTQHYFEF